MMTFLGGFIIIGFNGFSSILYNPVNQYNPMMTFLGGFIIIGFNGFFSILYNPVNQYNPMMTSSEVLLSLDLTDFPPSCIIRLISIIR